MRKKSILLGCPCGLVWCVIVGAFLTLPAWADVFETDLLIVGGNEAGCAAAVQAARLGVRRIVLVNDIAWLGGQFSAEGVGPVDERTVIHGKSANFPRSGLFLEMIRAIRAHNSQTYGVAAPGNCWSATETIEPAAAERLFEQLLAPCLDKAGGPVRLFRGWRPVRVACEGRRVTGVEFEDAAESGKRMTVNARMTLDASDWGDVIRLSGAAHYAGVDPKARFGEPDAPDAMDGDAAQEMNPLTWTATLREIDHDAATPRPPQYDRRQYTEGRPWVDSDMPIGIYANDGSVCAYTQRRLVDRRHFGLPVGTETIQLNSTDQDYPLCQLPKHVADRLEALEHGASRKNIVDMTPQQRQILFDDAKARTLGFLYYLQTELGERSARFRRMALSEEFGTPDRLPPKPYVREGLRLKALYMLREQDIRSKTGEPQWAAFRPEDAAFGFQFHIDFHPTRRRYLGGATNDGPWRVQHTASRNWHTTADRAMCPFRCFVPVDCDGLLGASKNIGVSSIVQAALRLHGQMMLTGQASATLAWLSLRENRTPRDLLASGQAVRRLQTVLVRGAGGPGVAIWPWQDLDPDAPAFEAANLLAVCGLWRPDPHEMNFRPDTPVTKAELDDVMARLCRRYKKKAPAAAAVPDSVVTWGELYTNLTANGFSASPSLTAHAVSRFVLTREELARHVWRAAAPEEKDGN